MPLIPGKPPPIPPMPLFCTIQPPGPTTGTPGMGPKTPGGCFPGYGGKGVLLGKEEFREFAAWLALTEESG